MGTLDRDEKNEFPPFSRMLARLIAATIASL